MKYKICDAYTRMAYTYADTLREAKALASSKWQELRHRDKWVLIISDRAKIEYRTRILVNGRISKRPQVVRHY